MRDYRHFLFFTERIEPDRLYLDPAETRHAVAVLRRAKGDPFLATDGHGTIYECRVESVVKKQLAGLIIGRTEAPRHSCSLHMLIGLPERAAFERLITDLTALGVERITPLVCRHCQGGWWERDADGERLSERFRSKMVVALKQSLYPYLPRLDPPLRFDDIASIISGTCMVADPGGVPVAEALAMGAPYACLVGPPGGFAPEEQAAFKAIGATSVQLAPTRLTTELAAVVACSQILGARQTGSPISPFPGSAA
ncbi:MAG: RsmE family RNA methyltransferase [Chitinispirillaceae bacterium]|jgi:16S rRNA (uracil1498-N3)-methyltransferase